MPRISVAENVVFDICRCLGTCPFDRKGNFSYFLSIPFVIVSSSVSILTLWVRYDAADFSKESWSNLTNANLSNKLKFYLGLVSQVPLVAPAFLQIWECFRNKHKFASIFQHLTIPSEPKFPLNIRLFLGIIFHFMGFIAVIVLYLSTNPLRRIAHILASLTASHLLNTLIIIQFSTLLEAVNEKLEAISKIPLVLTDNREFLSCLKLSGEIFSLYRRSILMTVTQLFTFAVLNLYYFIDSAIYRHFLNCCKSSLANHLANVNLRMFIMFLVTSNIQSFHNHVSNTFIKCVIIKVLCVIEYFLQHFQVVHG